MSQLTFQQLWGALAPALVSTKHNSHCWSFNWAGVVVALRLCEGVSEAAESDFQGPLRSSTPFAKWRQQQRGWGAASPDCLLD